MKGRLTPVRCSRTPVSAALGDRIQAMSDRHPVRDRIAG